MASKLTKRESDLKPMCRYGEKCYRKNAAHLEQFRHPRRKSEERSSSPESTPPLKKSKTEEGKKTTIEDFFKPKPGPSKTETPKKAKNGQSSKAPKETPAEEEEKFEESEEEDMEMPESPADVKESIKQKFLVEMPEDFYKFWEFCESLNSKAPTEALQETLGFTLVGPFDILAGKHKGVTKNSRGKRPNFLRHWRYYYDPPEFLTVIKGDDDTQFHLGYFRDDPAELPVLVGSNTAKNSCVIMSKGDNLFAAVRHCAIDQQSKASAEKKAALKRLMEKLEKWASDLDLSLELVSASMKERKKKVVCKTFHNAGMVVPVDANEVGYRPVPETPADLKKILKKIAESKTEQERNINLDPLQDIITLVQFANDEGDFGEGLELGLDVFSYGGKTFHRIILSLLPLAYQLLHRLPFAQILQAHLRRRSHTTNLSELD